MLAEKEPAILSARDSAVSFLQEQHAKTLQGLHSEIQKLQKKCASKFFNIDVSITNCSTRTDIWANYWWQKSTREWK